MIRLILVLILFSLLTFSCRKSNNEFIWERSYGTGVALFTKATLDSGVVACGELEGRKYLVRLDKKRNKVAEYKSSSQGLFNSVWFDTSCYIAGGSSEGKMLMARLDHNLNLVWEKTFSKSYYMDYTSVCYTGNGTFIGVGTSSADSTKAGSNGLLFVWLDTAGTITNQKEIMGASFISAKDVLVDNSGNIYIALTRNNTGNKPKASVAKFSNQLQKLWETELYNNPQFGAASLGIKLDNIGNIYISGKTELSSADGILNNSFVASLTNTGSVRWKKHLEDSNSGMSLALDNTDLIFMINTKCFIINILNPEDGSASGRIRVFSVCDSYKTDALGFSLDFNNDGNLLLAGSKGNSFYLALKPSLTQSSL
jgi:hypothetical protein